MRKRIAISLLLFLWQTGRIFAEAIPAESEIQKILQNAVEKQKLAPGIVVGVIDESGRKVISYGKPEHDSTRDVNGETVFEIGSVTKTFTACLLEKMVGRGELSLDDPAQKFLPKSVTLSSRNGKQITLRDLATHTSGLPRMPDNFAPSDRTNPYADYSVQQMYDFISEHKLRREIGSKYEYSNLGVGLLGHILSLKAGTNYEALVVKEICDPLKMNSTRIILTSGMKKRLAVGHDKKGNSVHNWDLPTFAGAGALRSTANDMLKYLAANLGLNDSPLSKTMAKTHIAQRPAGNPKMEIGLGWHVHKIFGSEFLFHNGATGGYHSFVGLDKEKHRGVVVLANSANDIDFIGRHLLNSNFKLPGPKNDASHALAKINFDIYDKYVGKYELAPEIFFTIARDEKRLFAQLTGQQSLEVFPESETEFFYKVVDAQLTFLTNKTETRALVLHQNGVDQEAKKIR